MRWNPQSRIYMKEHLPLYIFVSVLFVVGVIFGALIVNALSLEQRQDMHLELNHFLHFMSQNIDMSYKASFIESFWKQFKWIALIWLLGISVVGLPIIFMLNFLKGALIGFAVGYLVGQLSWKGMLFALTAVAPQNLIIIPALMITSVTAISFSIYIIKNRLMQNKGDLKQTFVTYSTVTIAMVGLLIAVALFESFVSPEIVKWVSPIVLKES